MLPFNIKLSVSKLKQQINTLQTFHIKLLQGFFTTIKIIYIKQPQYNVNCTQQTNTIESSTTTTTMKIENKKITILQPFHIKLPLCKLQTTIHHNIVNPQQTATRLPSHRRPCAGRQSGLEDADYSGWHTGLAGQQAPWKMGAVFSTTRIWFRTHDLMNFLLVF